MPYRLRARSAFWPASMKWQDQMRKTLAGRTPQSLKSVTTATPRSRPLTPETALNPMLPPGLVQEGRATVAKMEQVLAKTGSNALVQILAASPSLFEWRDYPEGGVWDRVSGCRYLYHAHPGEAFEGEHGHFHILVPGPEETVDAHHPREGRATALPALSMDASGRPLGWFVAPPWHMGGRLLTGTLLLDAIARCRFEVAFPCYAANLWLSAMVRAHADVLLSMSGALEVMLAQERLSRPGYEPLEDRERMILRAQKIEARAPVTV